MRKALKEMFFTAEDYLEDGQFTLAIQTYRKAIDQAKDDGEKILALSYIGQAYDDQGNERIASQTFKEMRQLAEKSFGHNSVEYAIGLSNEGMAIVNRHKHAKAEPFLNEAVQLLRGLSKEQVKKSLLGTWEGIVEIFAGTGLCKAQLGKVNEAIALMAEAYQIASRHLPWTSLSRVQASIEFAGILAALDRRAEADKITNQVIAALQKNGLHPVAAVRMIENILANTAAFFDGIETAQFNATKDSPETASTNTNVIPLIPVPRQENAAQNTGAAGYQLRITLRHVEPAIWRRIVVPSTYLLADLHDLIQRAMGWHDEHLHEFRIGRTCFGDPRQLEDRALDERRYTLAALRLSAGSKIEYEYDFGDGWVHSIVVEKSLNHEQLDASKTFVAGRGACPPEDCGGPYGYYRFLEQLKNPGSSDEEEDGFAKCYSAFDPEKLPLCFGNQVQRKTASKKAKKQIVLATTNK